MQVDNRDTIGSTAFFVVDLVYRRDLEMARVDGWKRFVKGRHDSISNAWWDGSGVMRSLQECLVCQQWDVVGPLADKHVVR